MQRPTHRSATAPASSRTPPRSSTPSTPTELSLDDIARRVASSRRQLQRAFAEIGSTTFREHLTEVRMDARRRHARRRATSPSARSPTASATASPRSSPRRSAATTASRRRLTAARRGSRPRAASPRRPASRRPSRRRGPPEGRRPDARRRRARRDLRRRCASSPRNDRMRGQWVRRHGADPSRAARRRDARSWWCSSPRAVGIALGLAIDWFPAQASTQAEDIDTFWDVLLIVSVPIFVLVTTVVLFCVWQLPHAAGRGGPRRPADPRQHAARGHLDRDPGDHHRRRCAPTRTSLLLDIEEAPAQARSASSNVTGQQFAWTFEYARGRQGDRQPTSSTCPRASRSSSTSRSKDVIHDFWVPEFRLKIDAVPGHHDELPRHARPRSGATRSSAPSSAAWATPSCARPSTSLTPADFDGLGAHADAGGSAGGRRREPAAGAAAVDAKALFAAGNAADRRTRLRQLPHARATPAPPAQTGPNLDEVLKGRTRRVITRVDRRARARRSRRATERTSCRRTTADACRPQSSTRS